MNNSILRDSSSIFPFPQAPKNVVLMSHLGRPDGKRVEKHSMKPVVPVLQDLLGKKVTFLDDCVGPDVENYCQNAKDGEVILLENLRFHIEEEGSVKDKEGNKIKADKEAVKKFRSSLTKLGDLYVNDAFGTAHRDHSSMTGVQLPIRAAGYLLKKELDYFGKALERPERPFLVILGGAKVKDKIKLITNLIDLANEIIIGGAMAFTFLKKTQGINIGKSLFDQEGYDLVDQILKKAQEKGVKIHLPVDFVCGDKFEASAQVKSYDLSTGVPDGWMGLDVGEQTIKNNLEVIKRAKTIVWNGPQGAFELEPFKRASVEVVNALTQATGRGATTIVGGGDSVALVQSVPGAESKLSHVSTGGGASLELLEGKTLPGIAYLTDIEELNKIKKQISFECSSRESPFSLNKEI
eukprot:TRINITY_DN3808_c0_g1_i4.p1 TRINITY_DN3808_c0_g1~~TRINITY_DN3808_c0_g1_i4.p1  ORF type:complete len:409 (+),score=142.89 TRINITY_DN3808_c0_g1_i4:269-1495(+)